MKTKQRTNQFLQTRLFFPKNQLENFLYHLQKMEVNEMYAALASKTEWKGKKIEKVFSELTGFIDVEKEFYNTGYLVLKRGICGCAICPNAGKQGYHLLSGSPQSENTFSLLIHHVNGEILDMDRCSHLISEVEKAGSSERRTRTPEIREIN